MEDLYNSSSLKKGFQFTKKDFSPSPTQWGSRTRIRVGVKQSFLPEKRAISGRLQRTQRCTFLLRVLQCTTENIF